MPPFKTIFQTVPPPWEDQFKDLNFYGVDDYYKYKKAEKASSFDSASLPPISLKDAEKASPLFRNFCSKEENTPDKEVNREVDEEMQDF